MIEVDSRRCKIANTLNDRVSRADARSPDVPRKVGSFVVALVFSAVQRTDINHCALPERWVTHAPGTDPLILVRPRGFEPLTFALRGQRSVAGSIIVLGQSIKKWHQGWIPAGWVAVTYAVRQHRPSLPYASVLAPPIRRIPGRPVSLRLAIGREMFHPVPRNFLAAADPDIFLRGHVIQEMAEGLRPCRVPGQSAMQAN